MSATDTQTLPLPECITIVLQAQEGGTLKHLLPFLKCGDQFAAEGFAAMIAGVSEGDLQMVLGQERDDRQMQAELQLQALGAPAHLAAHAQEMFDLLHRINVKVGGLNAVLGHGGEPSEQMWDEHNDAMDSIWDLLDKIQSAALVDTATSEQTTQNPGSLITENPVVAEPMHIDDRVKLVGSEPAFLTVVFELPSLNDAHPLIALLPYGQKALGTEAVVFGLTTGNLMEDAP